MSLKKDFISGLIKGFGFFIAILGLGIIVVFAANRYDSMTAVVGEGLTATKWNLVAKATVPSGAIMAFNSTTCPAEWTPADGSTASIPDLRGQFLRGMNTFDNGVTTRNDGKQDPISRSLRDYQADAFQGHWHNNTNSASDLVNRSNTPQAADLSVYSDRRGRTSATINIKEPMTDGTNGTPRTANETRPKNVAVIFCIKN